MKRRILAVSFGLLVMISGVALMQPPTPDTGKVATVTPMNLGAIKTATPTPLPPLPEDKRPMVCSAPYQEDWVPHVVKAGDTLASMLGRRNLTVTQAAFMNCIDDPSVLPVGSVIWLPVFGDMIPEPCQQLVTILDCKVRSQDILGAQQLFQNGMMLWREDTRQIWVILSDSTSLQVFDDTYVDGEADPIASPPNTFFVPKRGFGKVWTELGSEKSPLGWATAPEAQISLNVQMAGRGSYTTYVQLPDGGLYAATTLPKKSEGWWIKLGTE